MIETCGNKHPLTLQGLDVQNNKMAGLASDFAVYDERKIQDHLVFWMKIAEQINYYDGDILTPQGNWKQNLDKDQAVILGVFAAQQGNAFWSQWNTTLTNIKSGSNPTTMKKQWAYLFDIVFNAIKSIDQLYAKLEPGTELNKWIAGRAAFIQPVFKKWVAYHKTSKAVPTAANNLFNYNYNFTSLITPWLKAENPANVELTTLWYDDSFQDFNAFYQSLAQDPRPFLGITQAPVSPKEYISLGAHYAGIFETGKTLINFFISTINKAIEVFEKSLQTNNHEPHIAIMLTFLKLTEPLQAELNKLVDRHFDHFLKDVLQVEPKGAKNDSVFITAELSKSIDAFLIKKDTELKGGKDELGVERIYSTTQNVVLNKAEIAEVLAYKRNGEELLAGIPNTNDGIEAELEIPENGWPTFGKNNFPKAETGIAFGGEMLRMAEGQRTVHMVFVTKEKHGLKANDFDDKVSAFYSSEEGWEKVEMGQSQVIVGGKIIYFGLVISTEQPAMVDVLEDVHERNYHKEEPGIELLFEGELTYKLRDVQLEKMYCAVQAEDVQQLTLVNRWGALDSSKTFTPFGQTPKVGDYFTVGSTEVFSKNLYLARLNIDWEVKSDWLSNTWKHAGLNLEILDEKKWVDPPAGLNNNLTFNQLFGGDKFSFKGDATVLPDTPPENYSTKSTGGFLKINLLHDLGQQTYAERYLKAATAIAKNPSNTALKLPEEPYVPEISKISLNYSSTLAKVSLMKTKKGKNEDLHFYHISPFGGNPAHGNDLNEEYPPMVWNAENEGELYVGFKNYGAGSSVHTLFQLIEGSSNPLKPKQDVIWQYLENNVWKSFAESDLIDNSNGLIESGIVETAIPLWYKGPGTLMTSPLFWIRAAVSKNTDALCRLVSTSAQALKTTLSSTNHPASHYQNGLEAGTISKLVSPLNTIKKIEQPYASFGGAPQENLPAARNRISKRIRHKSRTVQMLDYEQEILENFKNLKQVRCLSHTKYEEDKLTNTIKYSESAPGHISVVSIPHVLDSTNVGIKRYTPISTLENIKNFLEKKTSVFVNVHVKNPIYYEIDLSFKVAFYPEITNEEFYKKQLQEELIQFLSPFSEGVRKKIFQSVIYKSEIIDFIDERPYVDYLKDLVVNVIVDRNDVSKNSKNVELAAADVQAAVLVSGPKHNIEIIL